MVHWCKMVAKNIKISNRATGSPAQRLWPRPYGTTSSEWATFTVPVSVKTFPGQISQDWKILSCRNWQNTG